MPKYNITIDTLNVREYRAYNPLEEKDTYSAEMRVAALVSVHDQNKKVAVIMKAEAYVKRARGMQMVPIGYIETETVFAVEHEWKRIKISKQPWEIDKGLESFLLDIAYGSTRGLLCERGKNDLMGKMILPVLDAGEIRSERE